MAPLFNFFTPAILLSLGAVMVLTALHFRWPKLPQRLARFCRCRSSHCQKWFVAAYWIFLPVVLYSIMRAGFS